MSRCGSLTFLRSSCLRLSPRVRPSRAERLEHEPGLRELVGLDPVGLHSCPAARLAGRVEVTARQAYELGFNVTLATDAMTDNRPMPITTALRAFFRRSARPARRRRSSTFWKGSPDALDEL
jgi:hypothetical protein